MADLDHGSPGGEARLRRHRVARERGRGANSSKRERGQACSSRPPARAPRASGSACDGAARAAGSRDACAAPSAKAVSQAAPAREQGPDAAWRAYCQSEEFETFQTAVESLRTLPSPVQLAEHRADYEVLLHALHRLGRELGVDHVSKGYRAHYSPDVQLCGYLYSTLLTAFTLLPSYVLNGQEFYVSDTVLDQCGSLQRVFEETCAELVGQFDSLQSHSFEHVRGNVRRSLVYFDRSWCRFEIPALEEIEAIHRQACRPLIDAIESEKALQDCEAGSRGRGSVAPGTQRARLETLQTRLVERLGELNRLANVDGKGRSDLDLACIKEAEKIAGRPMCVHPRTDADLADGQLPVIAPQQQQQQHQCGGCASPVLLRIARAVLRAFERLRRVLQRYGRCLYQLNSHLANNPDLVRGLELFESAWETATRFLVQSGPRKQALLAYNIVTGVRDPAFEENMVSLDPGFLVATLPRTFLFHEMRRFAASKGSAGAAQTQKVRTGQLKGLKAAASTSLGERASLPRPLGAEQLEGSKKPGASSAFHFSLLARAFLPPDQVQSYNEAAEALERLPPSRLSRLKQLLTSGSSCSSTPAGLGRAPTGGGGSPAALPPRTPGRPPMTPCPPRIGTAMPLCREEPEAAASDGEDEEPLAALDLRAHLGSAERELCLAAEGPAGQEPQVQQAVSRISTLALHLQRTKAHEWNELIQVVLQGVMLARAAR